MIFFINIFIGIFLFLIPFIIVYGINPDKLDELKQIQKAIILSIKSNKILFILSIIYLILSGYYFQIFLNMSELTVTFQSYFIVGTLLILVNLISSNIENLLFLPFLNNSIMNMKKIFFKHSYEYSHGEFQTSLSKCENMSFLIKNIFTYIKTIASFLVVFVCFFKQIDNIFYFFIFTLLSILLFIFNQLLVLFVRRKAWESTVSNRENSAKKILSNPYLIQGLFSLEKISDSIEIEKNKWNIFYIVLNGTKIISSIFYILFLIKFYKNISPLIILGNIKTCLLLQYNMITIMGYLDDIVKILKLSNEKQEIYSEKLTLKNVKLQDENITCLNELNFTMHEDIMVLNAPNGSGKSIFGKIIGKLIKTEGIIERPRTLYMSLDMHTLDPKTEKYSKGESVRYFIEKALINIDKDGNHYKLLILDEILDILNKKDENSLYYTILNKLLEKDIKLIIITHSILDLTPATKLNKKINYYTIKDKELTLKN